MRLKYQILWIENETDWVDSIEDQFQEYLNELGFSYERKLITKDRKLVGKILAKGNLIYLY